MPITLNATNSANSWCALSRPRCRNVQSRLPIHATTVAQVAEMIFAVIGLVSSGPPSPSP